MKGFHASWFRKRCPAIDNLSTLRRRHVLVACTAVAVTTFCAINVFAENCITASDMDPATRPALVAAGQRYFDFIAKGDAASLRQNAIPSLAADFSTIENTVA